SNASSPGRMSASTQVLPPDHVGLEILQLPTGRRFVVNPLSVRTKVPCGRALVERLVQNLPDIRDLFRGTQRDQGLDPAVEVAVHEIRRSDPYLGFAAVAELVRPRMLEEPTEDAAHPKVLTQAGDLRADRADPTHQDIDRHPGHRRAVQGVD